MKRLYTLFNILVVMHCFGQSPSTSHAITPQLDPRQLYYADDAILAAISNGEIPGAVLGIVHQNELVYLKAFGNKQTYPTPIAMETNTVFDLASLTKVIATTTSVMILVERGKLLLGDKVSKYLPAFKDNITIQQLLTHTSGLRSYAPVDSLLKAKADNPKDLMHYIATSDRKSAPGEAYLYSCLNFITLQRIIELVSEQNLRDFAKTNIFDVLEMTHTDFLPTGETLKRTAPTEKPKNEPLLKGLVHDPLARKLNHGISGNAGLFSDAYDLALFSAALMNKGTLKGKRILGPLTVQTMINMPNEASIFGRALGWDVMSSYASNQGNLLSDSTYGHTGYTGTSLVIDPENKIAIILLTHRVHPKDKGSVTRLRATVANIVAGAVTDQCYQQ